MSSAFTPFSRFVLTAICFALYVNVIPFACRLPGGLDWVAAYLPRPYLIGGLLFIGTFGSLPSVLLTMGFLLRKKAPIAFGASLIATTALLGYWHHDYDLSSDAQAGLGFIFIPIYTSVIAGAVYAAVAAAEHIWSFLRQK